MRLIHGLTLSALVLFLFAGFIACGGGGGGDGMVCEDLSAVVSPQIQDVRDSAEGNSLALSISGAFVTYVRDAIGSDPAGFYIQAEQSGPAVLIAVDPATLSPSPEVGDQVAFTVTTLAIADSLRQVTGLSSYSLLCEESSVSWLAQDVTSATDLVSDLDSYESELIHMEGEIVEDFSGAGSGFVSARVETTGITGDSGLRLRIPETLQGNYDLGEGCQFILDDAPMGRFNAIAQPTALVEADFQYMSCAAPGVVSAVAYTATSVTITFDRHIDPGSVLANGSQFTFTGGLTASAASVDEEKVTVTTSAQTPAAPYTVTVAATVTDTLGAGVDPAADSAAFAGFSLPSAIINEILYDAFSGDENGVFVELMGQAGDDLSGLSLVGVNGADGLDYRDVPLSGTIQAGGYFVIANTTAIANADTINTGVDFQNGPDSVQLIFGYGVVDVVIDAVGYGTFSDLGNFAGEGSPAVDTSPGKSLSRCPDGDDTDENSIDFIESTPTPGVANSCS